MVGRWTGGPGSRTTRRPGQAPAGATQDPSPVPVPAPIPTPPRPRPGRPAPRRVLGRRGRGGQPAGLGVDQRLLDLGGGQEQLQVVAHEHASHTGPLPGLSVGSTTQPTRAVPARPTPIPRSPARWPPSHRRPRGPGRPAAGRARGPPGGRGGTCWWPGSCWPTWPRAGSSWPWATRSRARLAGPLRSGAAGRGHQRHRGLERALRGRAAADPPVSERVATARALAL